MQRHHCIQRTSFTKERPLSFLHPDHTHLILRGTDSTSQPGSGTATKPLLGNHENPPHQDDLPSVQSRISVNASWKHQCLPHSSKLDTHFLSSPARRASDSSLCPAKPQASAGLQRGSQPSAALRPSESLTQPRH